MNQAVPTLSASTAARGVTVKPCSWRTEALNKIVELAALPENWDGYGSRRIQSAAQHQTTNLIEKLSQTALPAPQIFPVPGGGLQLEWQTEQSGAELEILPDGSMQYLIEDASHEMREGTASELEVTRLVRWLEAQETSIATF
ncbi:MAG: hypothetical protein HOP19_04165 [Acidobacteria bacterium]|nr:hypothetical protein [Acidobacteriota bacterium]